MATGKVVVRDAQWGRPCYIITKNKEERAIFHRWSEEDYPTDGGYIKHTLGIIEYDDGSVALVKPRSIVFADDICKKRWENLKREES